LASTPASLAQLDIASTLAKRNPVVVAAVRAFTQRAAVSTSTETIDSVLLSAVDLVYRGRHLKYTSEFGYLLGTVLLSTSGSPTASKILSKAAAAPGPTALRRWMARLYTSVPAGGADTSSSTVVPGTFDSGVHVLAIDNEQMTKKSWSSNKPLALHAVTTVLGVCVERNGTLLDRPELGPRNWPKLTDPQIESLASVPDGQQKLHDEQLERYLNAQIDIVERERTQPMPVAAFSSSTPVASMPTVSADAAAAGGKCCARCGTSYAKRKVKCDTAACKTSRNDFGNLKKISLEVAQERSALTQQVPTAVSPPAAPAASAASPSSSSAEVSARVLLHERLAERVSSKAAAAEQAVPADDGSKVNVYEFTMGRPVPVNPNSYATIKTCLASIKTTTGSGPKRFAILVCDGAPYIMISKLLEDSPAEYDWVVLVPGLLHEEMNMVKALVEFYWEIAYKEFGRKMGWTSERALAVFKKRHKQLSQGLDEL
jgi:hypothetical protein